MISEEVEVHLDSSIGAGVCPWHDNPYSLVSWWTMQKFGADKFYEIGASLERIRALSEKAGPPDQIVPPQGKGKTYLASVAERCRAIGLKASVKSAESFAIRIANGKLKLKEFQQQMQTLQDVIRWEMEDHLFMYVPAERATFYDMGELFGKEVNARFPTVQYDIVEAGNCYAAGRSTAVVFHLMRIMEVGVQEFGKKLGVALVNEKNWQNILDEINKAIIVLPKNPQRVEMSSASANLYAVKLAWRNEVMHPNDTYTLEEADNLIRQAKIFMEQLAKIV